MVLQFLKGYIAAFMCKYTVAHSLKCILLT